ncbi:hypothetical protein L208DRAFT_1406982 [Tricholoma matsutake]|nr:hypothetical protein L208DRAFT_1406982 [Tricholoma matsutake 945]
MPGENVLPGSFFFWSASPFPAIPISSVVQPPLFRQDSTEAQDTTPLFSLLLPNPVNDTPSTVQTGSNQLAPGLPHMYQPLLSSSTKVSLPLLSSSEPPQANATNLSMTPTDSAEKENNQRTVPRGIANRGRNKKKEKGR